MAKAVSFYAVSGGRCSGIFTSKSRVLDATVGYPGANVTKFLTLVEAEKFLKEKAKSTRGDPVVNGWSGPAYAVAVGRRMGIFRYPSAALSQTLCYSGNSLKKFSSYSEAVNFLDRHDWRKMPESDDTAGVLLTNEIVDDSSDAATSVISSEELSPQATTEIIPKRGREDKKQTEDDRPTQRRKVTSELSVSKETISALSFGLLSTDNEGRETILVVCEFPRRPEWNVRYQSPSANPTLKRAGLEAVLEALEIMMREDPECEFATTILVGRPLYHILHKCAECGWESVHEHRDLLERITRDRCVKFHYLGGTFKWDAC